MNWPAHTNSTPVVTAKTRGDSSVPLDAVMESGFVLITERYLGFNDVSQSGDKSEYENIQGQNRYEHFAHAVLPAIAMPMQSVGKQGYDEDLQPKLSCFHPRRDKFWTHLLFLPPKANLRWFDPWFIGRPLGQTGSSSNIQGRPLPEPH